jgi:hypothetical protein
MSKESCPKCSGEMLNGTAGVSALRLWFRPEETAVRHVSFKLTSAHADIVRAKACKACGYLEFHVDPEYLQKLLG